MRALITGALCMAMTGCSVNGDNGVPDSPVPVPARGQELSALPEAQARDVVEAFSKTILGSAKAKKGSQAEVVANVDRLMEFCDVPWCGKVRKKGYVVVRDAGQVKEQLLWWTAFDGRVDVTSVESSSGLAALPENLRGPMQEVMGEGAYLVRVEFVSSNGGHREQGMFAVRLNGGKARIVGLIAG